MPEGVAIGGERGNIDSGQQAEPVKFRRGDGLSSVPETSVEELVLATSAAAYWMPRSSQGMTAMGVVRSSLILRCRPGEGRDP
ncbi:hypothetical protein CWO91_05840 [Bradyrhizobium genosp. SA-3]|nr:hypothetical protein CWO91_05840 [Bradyrhizobium genosp. SA-3]